MFFDSWDSILRTLVITILAYVVLIFLLRISGKRTLSKMNAFDFIVTIALGSTLATVLLNKSVSLADGVLALSLLIGLQFLITFFSVRSKRVSKLVKSIPTLLVYKGDLLQDAMRKERVNADEIYAILREKGISSIQDVDAVILETDGSLNVIKCIEKNLKSDVMQPVKAPPDIQ
ncbi:membrane protein [Nitrosomonas communis]|uniref:Membrane protein n=1 Tax=Nitrosomonas communis TaxID=44574 RepID=A0A0F7KJ57_9PROT|nr:membrane protein [Nitrosomonas communis]